MNSFYTHDDENLEGLFAKVNELLISIVTKSLVIDKQPPQIMKINDSFSTSIRFLAAGPLAVDPNNSVISASIVNGSTAEDIKAAPMRAFQRKQDFSSGDMINSYGTMVLDSGTRKCLLSFENVQLKTIHRPA